MTLVSRDPELLSFCRETAAVSQEPYNIALASPEDAGTESDLYLWDLAAAEPPEWARQEPWRHYFLVDRSHAAEFRESAGGVNVLLKPLVRSALEAVLKSAASRIGQGVEDCDLLLQSLADVNIRLQEYDQDRDNFLARAAHDFRAPLTAIAGYCGLLLGEPLGPVNDGQREVLRRMLHSARRLSRMTYAMFRLSVERRAERPIDLRASDMRACLEQSLHDVALPAAEKRIAISADLAPGWQELRFDPEQIEQVLTNLLDNACKFVPKSGAIDIRGYRFFWERRRGGGANLMERRRCASREPNSYRIDVSDSGAALPERNLERIFEEYTTVEPGPDRSGAGLGLAICRSIVNRHGGRIWAENGPSGPIFCFVLPFAQPGARSADADANIFSCQEVN